MQVREFSTCEDAVKLIDSSALAIWQDGYCRISGRGVLTVPCESERLAWELACEALTHCLLNE